jgi:endoglycosylceramidase
MRHRPSSGAFVSGSAVHAAFLAGVVALGMACSHGAAPQGPRPPWSVSGGFLRDAQGRAVILRGANVSGMNKHAPWFDFQGPADFARIRDDWGMNAVRLLVLWAALEPQSGQYDDAYLDAVAQRVQWAQDADLFVVLDMHQDVYGEGFASGGGDGAPLWTCDASHDANFKPTTPWFFNDVNDDVLACYDGFWSSDDLKAHYAEAWRRIAARLAGFDHVVGFDPMNEPYWGTHAVREFEPDVLQPFYEKVVPVVRSEAPRWIAFIEPSSSRNIGLATSLVTPSFSDFVYSPHSYDRNAESGMGFDPANRPAILTKVGLLAQEAQALGGALWIGEYGGNATSAGIVDYMTAEYDAAGAVAASSMYWDYSKGGYGMLAADGSEAQPLVNTLVRPYPERVAGDPVSWTYDSTTSTFTLTYHADGQVTGPTIVSVPTRLYPKGFAVDCGGCSTTMDGAASLVVTTPPPGDPAVLTIHP